MKQKTLRNYTHYPYLSNRVQVGEEVILVERHDLKTGDITWLLRKGPEGISGNSDPHVKRFHGWRGTTNDISLTAHGLRRVIKTRDVDSDTDFAAQVVTVGKDLHPDWE